MDSELWYSGDFWQVVLQVNTTGCRANYSCPEGSDIHALNRDVVYEFCVPPVSQWLFTMRGVAWLLTSGILTCDVSKSRAVVWTAMNSGIWWEIRACGRDLWWWWTFCCSRNIIVTSLLCSVERQVIVLFSEQLLAYLFLDFYLSLLRPGFVILLGVHVDIQS